MDTNLKHLVVGLFVGAFFATSMAMLYDRTLRDSGTFRVLNSTTDSLTVSLEFPSGATEDFILTQRPYRFSLSDTGEGSIRAVVNDVEIGSAGYVTSMNPPLSIVLGYDDIKVVVDH